MRVRSRGNAGIPVSGSLLWAQGDLEAPLVPAADCCSRNCWVSDTKSPTRMATIGHTELLHEESLETRQLGWGQSVLRWSSPGLVASCPFLECGILRLRGPNSTRAPGDFVHPN